MSNDPKGKHLDKSIANLASREDIESSKWLTSKETMSKLGISGCDLMHKHLELYQKVILGLSYDLLKKIMFGSKIGPKGGTIRRYMYFVFHVLDQKYGSVSKFKMSIQIPKKLIMMRLE